MTSNKIIISSTDMVNWCEAITVIILHHTLSSSFSVVTGKQCFIMNAYLYSKPLLHLPAYSTSACQQNWHNDRLATSLSHVSNHSLSANICKTFSKLETNDKILTQLSKQNINKRRISKSVPLSKSKTVGVIVSK